MSSDNQSVDYNKPVAYDADGQPLYAHPPSEQQAPAPLRTTEPSHVTTAPAPVSGAGFDPATRVQYSNEPGVRHVKRPVEPPTLPVSDAMQQRHERSKRLYPTLNLSKGEYVIMVVHRHPIGLFIPVFFTLMALGVIAGLVAAYPSLTDGARILGTLPAQGDIVLIGTLLGLLVTIFGYITVWVYLRNRLILTNESVIQELQISLFSKHEQTASLGSIEDVSFKKSNILQVLLDYGTIRLSTEGEETTYRFQFVADPKRQTAILNNAVEDFKNGRPVSDD